MFMINEHTKDMWKNLFSSLIFVLILCPFIWAGFFDILILCAVLPFPIYQMIISQYYKQNERVFELKDLLFALCYTLLFFLVGRLFHITFSFDQNVILFSAVFIAVVNVGCSRRIRIESSQKD